MDEENIILIDDEDENIEDMPSEEDSIDETLSEDSFPEEEQENPIISSVLQYYETDSVTDIPDNNSDNWILQPTLTFYYLWNRTVITYQDGTIEYTEPQLDLSYQEKDNTIIADEDTLILRNTDLFEDDFIGEPDEPETCEPAIEYITIGDWVNQTGIFNLLTNNGTANGIYMQEDENGVNQLYINMTYARSGVLQVGGSENSLGVFQVLDENNQDIGHWDKQGIMLNGGVIQSKDNKSWWNLNTGTLNLNGYITSYKTEYAVGGSMTEAPTSGWSQTAPTQVPEGQYIWQRSTLKRTGDADQVKTVCLSGRDGTDGRGIRSANIQYYLSTSNERLEGGSWSDAAPSYVKNRYYWTRTKTVYTDGVTEYSDNALDMGLTDANRIAADANASATLAHEASQQAKADAADAKTASTQAQSDAALAQGAATRAETSASQAATSAQNASDRADEAEAAATNAQTQASNAATSASTAQTRANEAAQSATRAQGSASRAETAATNAQTQASNAATAASQAKADAKTAKDKAEEAIQDAADAASAASQAQTSADNAQSSADAAAQAASRANTTANGAVTSLGILQGVVDNLGDDVDDLQTHVAMMDAITDENGKVIVPSGLHVVPTSNGYFVVVSNDGMYVYDPQSVLVATFGENINFNSYRPQRIGGADAYIEYYDSNNDGKADALRIIGAKVDITGGTKIQSNNYQASQNASSPYSATGTFLDLSNGRLYMPNFGVDADGKAYINGEIIATSGKIGEDSTSYWEIGTQTDYNNDDSAALIGHGTSFIQTGDFQLSNGLLNTRSYTANHQITYPKYDNTYWDFGIQAPTLDTTTSSYIAGIDDNFIYIRNHANTIPSWKQDWNYLYRVDKNGNIYTTGQIYINGQSLDQLYASISDVDSSFLPTTGGTINGNLTVTGSINGTATKATQLTHTLSINNKTWDGSSNMDVGTLGVAYGGTGGTTFTSGAALIGNGQGAFQTRAITNNTSANYISGSTNLITANTLKFWNGAYDSSHTSNLEYVKLGKLGTVVTHDLEDFITTEGGIIDGSLTVTDLNAGSLVVTGAARFTNAIYGDLTGNADTADKVNHDLIIKLNSGTTEGTNMFTFDGSAAKTVNVTKSAIGLGNVENTALSTWAGSANLTTTKVGTLAAAATKGVDSSIAAASTSSNLPTSAAVAAFVEGKNYVTSSGVTSVRVQATSPVVSSVNTAQTATLNTTISLADGYGDTKNPYASKTKNYVLAAPSDANGVPTFRALVADDIPTLTPSKVGLGNVTNYKQVKGLSSGTTNGHLVTWGADGYTVADSGIAKGSVATKLTLAGTDYSASSNAITVTQANLQSAVQSTGLVLMTSAERSKLSSIQVSEGGTIDFSGVTASSPLTATVATDKKVNITHNTSGVSAGTYRSVTVNTYGHVTGGTNPTTLSGYGITDAKIASGVITLGSNTITPLTASSTLDATKLSGTASISTTGNAGTATKFNSSRTIALTGDVTGSASGDGSSGWSVATTVKDDSHNHTTQTFIPISTKTYTNITVTGNSNPAGWLYFAKMIPVNNDYGKHAYVKYRLKSTMAGLSGNLGHEETDMEIMMYNNALLWYKVKNNISNTSYRPFYNHLIYRAKQAGITGGYGHLLGVRLQSSYDPTNSTYARTFEIEILETRNCSITFFDSMILYANAPGTGSTNYDGITELNGTTQGDTHTGDANDITTTVYSTPRITATTTPLMQNSLIMQDSTGAWQSICVGTAGTGTAKTKNTAGFVLGQIYYFSSGTIAVGNQSTTGVIRNNQDWVDFRYTSNCASTLTKYAPIYIVGTMNNGLFYLDDIWWTQTTPTSNDGHVYIPVGMAYDTPYYSFWGWKGAYYHDGTGLRPYVEASIASDYVRLDGTSKMTGNLTIRKIGTGANNWASRTDNPSLIFETTDNQSAGFVFTQYDSVQAPSSVTLVGNSPGAYFIAPNIKALDSFYGDLSGNASTATKATQDGDGHTITSTYVNLTGAQTISGTKTFSAMPVASAGLCVGNSGTAGGLSLWSDKDVKRYGLALRSASDSGKHGYVQGGYATYNYMYSADDTGVYTRGWIFKDSVHDKGVASISGAGNAVFNGSVTVGGNAANTSGWRLEKDENLDCLNFIFVA